MIITKKSIRNVEKYLSEFKEGESFYIGIRNLENYADKLSRYGLKDMSEGDTFLPRPIKNVTKANANGKIVIDKTQKEERTFERAYHNVDWHGEDHYGTYYCTKLCYKRKFSEPLGIELTYSNGILLSNLLKYEDDNKDLIKHIINMYLEMFGNCETLTKDLVPKELIKLKKLEWKVLPQGEYPWKTAKSYIEKIIMCSPTRSRKVIGNRHRVITNNTPDFMAVGDQSFYGYVIYGFKTKNVYIFESNQPDNATYVFRGNWEQASKLTKAEILGGGLCESRIIHNKNWENRIKRLTK